jgi:hypothetical protein
MRQVARVAVVNPIGAAIGSNDVAATVKYREGMTVLERTQSPLLKGNVRLDVERRLVVE